MKLWLEGWVNQIGMRASSPHHLAFVIFFYPAWLVPRETPLVGREDPLNRNRTCTRREKDLYRKRGPRD